MCLLTKQNKQILNRLAKKRNLIGKQINKYKKACAFMISISNITTTNKGDTDFNIIENVHDICFCFVFVCHPNINGFAIMHEPKIKILS